eukprot:g21573.t1
MHLLITDMQSCDIFVSTPDCRSQAGFKEERRERTATQSCQAAARSRPTRLMTDAVGVIAATATAVASTKLSNADFREHLSRRRIETEEYRQKKAAILDDDADEIGKGPASGVNRKKKAAQRLDSYKRWQERKAKSNKESKETKKYRDRAQEWRAGKDSAFTEEELEKYKSLSYEQSKFLGGDMEHTHLVKGLDFALVAKKREELERLEEARLESAATSNDIAKKKEEEPEVETANLPQFASTLARNLYNWTQNQRAERIAPVDYFLKGRMTFEFDLDPEFSKSVPTTIIHPMTDVEQEGDRIPGLVDRTVLKKMAKIMTLMREGSLSLKKKKKKKKDAGMEEDENIEEEIRRQAMLEEVDMFAANAASASKVKADNEAPAAAANSKTAGNYFDGPSVLKQAETEYSDAQDKAKAAESEPEDKKTKAKTTEDKKKDPMQVEEYYEAYPSYGGLSDDDEDDLSKMDQGRGRDRLRPWDFDTEGEWESYNSNREANPKAAFQFGLKMADGRKQKISGYRTAKEQGEAESRKREQRFNADFQKITALMKKRDKAMGKTTVQSSAVDSERAQKRQKILSAKPSVGPSCLHFPSVSVMNASNQLKVVCLLLSLHPPHDSPWLPATFL